MYTSSLVFGGKAAALFSTSVRYFSKLIIAVRLKLDYTNLIFPLIHSGFVPPSYIPYTTKKGVTHTSYSFSIYSFGDILKLRNELSNLSTLQQVLLAGVNQSLHSARRSMRSHEPTLLYILQLQHSTERLTFQDLQC